MYPKNVIQTYVNDWWIKTDEKHLERGRLIWAFVPFVHQIPNKITAIGRKNSIVHNTAKFRIEPIDINARVEAPRLPVAALPLHKGEVNAVYVAKKRPAVVISTGGPSVPKELRFNKPKRQTSPSILVAPYYGRDEGGERSGYSDAFVERVKACEYPNFMWDKLPIGGNTSESILRLNQLQPLGNAFKAYELTEFRLSEDAIAIMDEWINWLFSENLFDDGVILDVRESYLQKEKEKTK